MVERPLEMRPGKTVTLRAIADGTCPVVYANDQTALSARQNNSCPGWEVRGREKLLFGQENGENNRNILRRRNVSQII